MPAIAAPPSSLLVARSSMVLIDRRRETRLRSYRDVHADIQQRYAVQVVHFVRCSGVSERVPFDSADYERRTREGPCFICAIAAGESDYRGATTIIHEDADVLVFLNRYPTLRGYTLVCPRRHVEHVVGDTTAREYLQLQRWVYRVGQAVQQVVPTE